MKYLKLIPGSYEYVAQKSQILGKETNIKNASVTIEPLNNDYASTITYTPINQSMPIDTLVTLNISTPYNNTADTVADRMWFWSSNLRTVDDINEIIRKNDPESITVEPWMRCIHYGSIDIGSVINAKFSVDWVDTDLYSSYSLYNFRRYDHMNQLQIWMYDAFNVNFKNLITMLHEHTETSDAAKVICDEVLSML